MLLNNKCICLLLLSCLALLQGCVAIQSFPTIARAGDTITLAVGTPDGMTKDNVALMFTPSNGGTPIDISSGIRSIIKINPDETSGLSLFQAENVQVLENDAGHGAWLSLIVLDLPDETVLPVGEGVINVDTTASYSRFSPVVWPSIGIEILPGTGEPNQFEYEWGGGSQPGDLSMLESLTQVVARPNKFKYAGSFAAAEVKLDIPMQIKSDGSYVNDGLIRIVHDETNATRSKQIQMFWSRSGDVLTVNFLCPSVTMLISDMRFSVVLYATTTKTSFFEFISPPGPVVNAITVFDADGAAIYVDVTAYGLSIE